MNTNIENLLNRYLQDKTSDEENARLMELLSSGRHDELVKHRIAEMLTEAADEDMSTARAEQMLNTILAPVRHGEAPVIPLPPVAPARRLWWVAAAVIVLAITAGITLMLRNTDKQAPQTIAQNDPAVTVYSGKQYIHLPDGSAVLLNDNSELRYEPGFGTEAREVFLAGEAYFDIKHDATKPFRVHTGKVITTVLGTAFNVKAWPDAGEVKVTVDRGKVQVGDGTHAYGTITRDQQIAVNTSTYVFEQTSVKAQAATEWKSAYLIFEDVSLEVAAAMIEEKYKVAVTFDNDKLKACRVSATFLNNENLSQVMTVLTAVIQATYTQEDNHIIIRGAGCA